MSESDRINELLRFAAAAMPRCLADIESAGADQLYAWLTAAYHDTPYAASDEYLLDAIIERLQSMGATLVTPRRGAVEQPCKQRVRPAVRVTQSQHETYTAWLLSDESQFWERMHTYEGPCPVCARCISRPRRSGSAVGELVTWRCGTRARLTIRFGQPFGKMVWHKDCVATPYEVIPQRARPSYRPPQPLIEL